MKKILGNLWAAIKTYPEYVGVALFVGVLTTLASIAPVVDWIRGVLPAVAYEPHAQAGVGRATGSDFSYGFAVFILVSSGAIFVSVVSFALNILGGGRERSRAFRAHQTALEAFTTSAYSIAEGLYQKQRLSFDIVSMKEHYLVASNGDVTCEKTAIVQGGDEPGFVWRIWEEADASAPPVELLQDISLFVSSAEAKTQAIVLPTENTPTRQEFAIFLLPPLAKDEKRTINVRYRWPGFATDLVAKRYGRWFWTLQPRPGRSTCHLQVAIQFEQAIGELDCQNIGFQSPSALPLRQESRLTANDTWVYEDPTAVMDGTQYDLEFKRART